MERKIIETDRLYLTLFSLDDAEFLMKLYNSPMFIQFVGDRNIKTEKDAKNYIQNKFFPQIEKLGFGNYLISLKENGEKIGAVGIFEREGLDVMDVGFSFLPEFEGKGYGFESANALIQFAKKEFGVKKVSAITLEANVSSRKLIEKLGLKFKKNIFLPNDPEELMYFEGEI